MSRKHESELNEGNQTKIRVQDVSGLDITFGGNIQILLPPYEEIPEGFKRQLTKWNRVAADWFFFGLCKSEWKPKEGIETGKALRHIKAIMGSFEPKHEHKMAGCAYLLSEFFEDVQYERAK